MTKTLVRTLTDAEQSAQHLAEELEQLLRTIHPDDQSDAEAVHDAVCYCCALRECLADLGTPDADDPSDVTLPAVDDDDDDAVMLSTRIPEDHRVDGLTYGAHVSRIGWCGYYVRPHSSSRWGVARLTPASNELPEPDEDETQDETIVRCIRAEFAGEVSP